jgi:hypothetical protein
MARAVMGAARGRWLWASVVALALFVYDGPIRGLVPGAGLPAVPGGLNGLTSLLVVFSVCHAVHVLGARHAGLFFVTSAAIT